MIIAVASHANDFADTYVHMKKSELIVIKIKRMTIYFRGLSKCNSGAFDRIVGTYTELASHEKVLDDLISLLRKDQVMLKYTVKHEALFDGGCKIFVRRLNLLFHDYVEVCGNLVPEVMSAPMHSVRTSP